MRLKELKCKNCGAQVEVEENAKQAKCKFCHTSFAVESAYNDGYDYEKGRIKAHTEQLEETAAKAGEMLKNSPIPKIFAAHYIVTAVIGIIIFIVAIVMIITISTRAFKHDTNTTRKEMEDVINETINDPIVENIMDEYDISRFNSSFEMYQGTEIGSSVGRLLDKVITNNKKEDTLVTVQYKETVTTDPNEIKELKKSFDEWTDYEVSFDYDENKMITKVIIEDLA